MQFEMFNQLTNVSNQQKVDCSIFFPQLIANAALCFSRRSVQCKGLQTRSCTSDKRVCDDQNVIKVKAFYMDMYKMSKHEKGYSAGKIQNNNRIPREHSESTLYT
jgi:hypothetical protein